MTEIPIRGTQCLELFVQTLGRDVRELWVVVSANGQRLLHDHYLTEDDLEATLCYARSNDLVWRDAAPSQLPSDVAKSGMHLGKNIPADKIIAFSAPRDHLAGALVAFPCDRRTVAAARRDIIGEWSDGTTALTFGRSSLFHSRPARVGVFGVSPTCPSLDSWTFAAWQLHLLNSDRGCGVRVPVLALDAEALHIAVGPAVGMNAVAQVFRRQLSGSVDQR